MAIWLVGPAIIQRLPPINEPATISVITIPVNQVIETDLAQPFTNRRTITFGQCTETDTAQTFNVLKEGATLGQCIEVDLAQSFRRVKNKTLGQCEEIDLAQPFIHTGPIIFGLSEEIDLAQPFVYSKSKTIGLNTETDLAQTIIWSPKKKLINQVIEIDFALRFTRLKNGVVVGDEEQGNVFVGSGLSSRGLRRRKRELLWWA